MCTLQLCDRCHNDNINIVLDIFFSRQLATIKPIMTVHKSIAGWKLKKVQFSEPARILFVSEAKINFNVFMLYSRRSSISLGLFMQGNQTGRSCWSFFMASKSFQPTVIHFYTYYLLHYFSIFSSLWHLWKFFTYKKSECIELMRHCDCMYLGFRTVIGICTKKN